MHAATIVKYFITSVYLEPDAKHCGRVRGQKQPRVDESQSKTNNTLDPGELLTPVLSDVLLLTVDERRQDNGDPLSREI